MQSLRKRLDSAVSEIQNLQEEAYDFEFPPCFLITGKDGRIRCDYFGPAFPSDFKLHCDKCFKEIKESLKKYSKIFK